MLVYKLTFYVYSTYSYDGIIENDSHYFMTKDKAFAMAAKHGYTVVNYCSDPEKECTIERIGVVE